MRDLWQFATSGAKARFDKRGLIAAPETLRHPKAMMRYPKATMRDPKAQRGARPEAAALQCSIPAEVMTWHA